jgi:hypothetical protein
VVFVVDGIAIASGNGSGLLTSIASSGALFTGFDRAAVSDNCAVVFEAFLTSGGSGVFSTRAGSLLTIA